MTRYETVKQYADHVYNRLSHRAKVVVDVIEAKWFILLNMI